MDGGSEGSLVRRSLRISKQVMIPNATTMENNLNLEKLISSNYGAPTPLCPG